jgi:hypothetical protein
LVVGETEAWTLRTRNEQAGGPVTHPVKMGPAARNVKRVREANELAGRATGLGMLISPGTASTSGRATGVGSPSYEGEQERQRA